MLAGRPQREIKVDSPFGARLGKYVVEYFVISPVDAVAATNGTRVFKAKAFTDYFVDTDPVVATVAVNKAQSVTISTCYSRELFLFTCSLILGGLPHLSISSRKTGAMI